MRLLTISEVVYLHQRAIQQSGGATGLRDFGALDSAVALQTASFADVDLYPTLDEKAAALCFSLVMNHPFVDGNKRTGHAALEQLLLINGFELDADVDDAERTFLALASGELPREALVAWVRAHIVPDKRGHGR